MKLKLPEPQTTGKISVEEALSRRRSTREYGEDALSLSEVSQLLWSGYGVTSPEGLRTTPSAMTLYPLEFYLNATHVDGLPPGFYQYVPSCHELKKCGNEPKRAGLYKASFEQTALARAPAILVITGIYERTTEKFGETGPDYVHMDLGHAAQNIHIQAVSLNLGTVVIAAFRRDDVKELLGLPEEETPLYMMPVGHPLG